MISPRDIAEVLSRPGLGHKTLAEHGVTCRPGQRITLDPQGNEICTGTETPPVYVIDAGPMNFGALPWRGGGHHHHHPHRVGHAGLGADAGQVQSFQSFTRSARQRAAAGDATGARASYAAAEQTFAAMGSPPAYQDDLDYAREAAYGSAASEIRQQGAQRDAAEQNAQPGSIGFTDDPLAALYFRGVDPARIATGGFFSTEEVAAEQREVGSKLGISALERAAAPQSGRDASTKPPVSLPENTGRVALGAAIGGAIGVGFGWVTQGPSGSSAVVSGLAGSVIGGFLGYATGKAGK